ncbi:MAG: sn-glycerol-3-phosphate ABC transporter ATP-binding protein UgpC [Mesorhizobium sp.]|nr:MAG: sn-glycerol-3-phosphate ABC transporter ATP-binding protein UgpC [Mesorhizobium sp.]
MAEVSLKAVKKSYGRVDVIKGVDIHINDGEFVVFVGPSGCGKSTLLRVIAGLEDITEGILEIGGRVVNELPPKERGVAMVFQSYAIFPHMTVRENIAFGLTIAGAPKQEKEQKVAEAARILQMEHLLDRRPSQLSGGQRQRVAIGRAIVRNPKVFLFDEPLSNLDAALRVSMRLELMRLHEHLAATMIYVTHDQTEAMTMADKIVVLNGGSIEQVGSPLDLYIRPANIFVAGFIGSPKMNLLKLKVASTGPEGVTVTLPDGQALTVPVAAGASKSGDDLLLGMRPEHLRVSANGQFKGQAVLAERLGSLTILHVEVTPDVTLVVQAGGGDTTPLHSPIALDISPSVCHLFRMDGPALAPLQPG